MPVSAHLRCTFDTKVLRVMCDGACRHAGTVRGDGVDRSAGTSPKLRPERASDVSPSRPVRAERPPSSPPAGARLER